MLTIWGRRNSINVQKVMWTVGELSLDYVRENVGGSFGELDTPEYRAMNPNGLVPVLEDERLVLWESQAIVRYLAARHPETGLWPEGLAVRAVADQWMDWMHTTLLPDLFTVFFGLVRTPAEARDMEKINAAAKSMGEKWSRLDAHLTDNDYVAGKTFTMGDIPVGAACYRYHNMAIDRPKLPNVEAWYARLQQRPAYQEHVMIPFGSTLEEWLELEKQGA
ncbi:MAG: glutathione S-transferase family protein [Gammaproteobacteria bacterium]